MHQRKNERKKRKLLGKCSSQKVADCTSRTQAQHLAHHHTTAHHLPYPPSTVSLTRSGSSSSSRYFLYLRWSRVQRVSSLFTRRSYSRKVHFKIAIFEIRLATKRLPGPSGRLADVDSFLLFDRRVNDGI